MSRLSEKYGKQIADAVAAGQEELQEVKIMDAPPDAGEIDESTQALMKAAELLAKAATDKKNKGAILKEVEESLSRVKLIDFPDLAESPIIQNFIKAMGMDDLKPGETRNRGTLAEREREWSWGDLNKAIKDGRITLEKLQPNENIKVTWNGLELQLLADEVVEIPRPFYDVYMDHVKATRQGRLHEQYLLGKSDVPPDRNWLTPESAVVRAWSKQGDELGLVSGFLSTGILKEGEE